jgi:hypothetical protein
LDDQQERGLKLLLPDETGGLPSRAEGKASAGVMVLRGGSSNTVVRSMRDEESLALKRLPRCRCA